MNVDKVGKIVDRSFIGSKHEKINLALRVIWKSNILFVYEKIRTKLNYA